MELRVGQYQLSINWLLSYEPAASFSLYLTSYKTRQTRKPDNLINFGEDEKSELHVIIKIFSSLRKKSLKN